MIFKRLFGLFKSLFGSSNQPQPVEPSQKKHQVSDAEYEAVFMQLLDISGKDLNLTPHSLVGNGGFKASPRFGERFGEGSS